MAYEMVMPYHLHMPSYFLETFTEYPSDSLSYNLSSGKMAKKLLILIRCKQGYSANLFLNNTINPTDSL